MHDLTELIALVALQVRHPTGAVDYLSRRPEGIPDKPIPAWWCLFAIASGLYFLYGAYKALGNGEIWAGRHSYWTSAKYYNRATQPTRFWFTIILQVCVASVFVIAGLVFLRPTH